MRVVVIADFADAGGGAQRVALEFGARACRSRRRGHLCACGRGERHGRARPSAHRGHRLRASRRLGPAGRAGGAQRRLERARGRSAEARARRASAGTCGDPPPPVDPRLLAGDPAGRVRLGAPVAITLHDYFLACPNGVYYRFDRAEPCTLAPLSARCIAAPCDPRSYAHKAVRVLRTALTRRAIRGRRLHLIHVSDRGQATIAPFLPDSAIHHRVDNPVAVERGPPAEMRDGARIAFIGRLTREKGADLVAQAARDAGPPGALHRRRAARRRDPRHRSAGGARGLARGRRGPRHAWR